VIIKFITNFLNKLFKRKTSYELLVDEYNKYSNDINNIIGVPEEFKGKGEYMKQIYYWFKWHFIVNRVLKNKMNDAVEKIKGKIGDEMDKQIRELFSHEFNGLDCIINNDNKSVK
jgi:hypothetical protein